MLSITDELLMLSVIMLNVVMQSVVASFVRTSAYTCTDYIWLHNCYELN